MIILQQGQSEPEFYGDLVYKIKEKKRADFWAVQKNYNMLQIY